MCFRNLNVKTEPGASPRRLSAPAVLGLLLCACCLAPASSYAAKIYPSAGTTSATFLKIGAGARAEGMAGAFTAVADDPSAVYWNPAGLVYADGKALSFSHYDRFQGLNQEFLSYILPGSAIGPLKNSALSSGVWGLGLNYFHTQKDLERRSGADEVLNVFTTPEGSFRAYDLAFSLSYGWRPRPGTGLGATLKAISQTIDDRSGATLALDLGAVRDLNWLGRDFTGGLTLQNLGPGVKFTSQRYPLPLTLKAGLSHKVPGAGVLLSLDAAKPVDNYPSFTLGMEYPLTSRLSIRTGYKYRLYGNETGGLSGLAAGFGLVFGRLSFDYAFTPSGELGNNHILSLAFKFSEPSAAARNAQLNAAAPELQIINEKTFVYELTPRALTISPQGVLYDIRAAAREGDVPSLRFKALSRDPAVAALSLSVGEPSGALIKGFPRGYAPARVFQFAAGPGPVQGGIAFELQVSTGTAAKDLVSFFYLSGTSWKQAAPEFAGEDAGFLRYRVSAPYAPRYAIGVKKP